MVILVATCYARAMPETTPASASALHAVAEAANAANAAATALLIAMAEARQDGCTLREIAGAAGVDAMTVKRRTDAIVSELNDAQQAEATQAEATRYFDGGRAMAEHKVSKAEARRRQAEAITAPASMGRIAQRDRAAKAADARRMVRHVTQCAAFALCDREAIGTFSHPVLGEVPTCQRCADKLAQAITGAA